MVLIFTFKDPKSFFRGVPRNLVIHHLGLHAHQSLSMVLQFILSLSRKILFIMQFLLKALKVRVQLIVCANVLILEFLEVSISGDKFLDNFQQVM